MNTGLKTWHTFAFLIATAILYYYAGRLLLAIAAIVLVARRLNSAPPIVT
jgi:hypothetical protein